MTTPLVGEFNIDFAKKDYLALVEQADAFLTSILPEWTDRDDNDINWATVKTVAYLLSIGMFYIDLGVNEKDPYEVQIYRNALKLARQYGYPARKVKGATVQVDLTIPVQGTQYTIARGENVSVDGKEYVILEDVVFPTGVVLQPADCQYGSFERYELGTSDATDYQEFKVDRDLVQDKAVRVFIDEGGGFEEWDVVDTLLMSYESDKHCRVYLDDDEKYVFVFGDNKSGKVPVGSSAIEVEIITIESDPSLNNYGNIPLGNIDTCSDSLVELVVQGEDATGGGVKETVVEIGRALPQWITTAGKAVALKDYIYLAKRVGGVADAQVFQDGVLVDLYLIPVGGGLASSALQTQVYNYIEPRKLPNINLNTLTPTEVDINTTIAITVNDNYKQITVKGQVTEVAQGWLNQPTAVGKVMTLLELYNLINNVDGVDRATVTELYKAGDPVTVGDVELDVSNVPNEGTVTINASGGIV